MLIRYLNYLLLTRVDLTLKIEYFFFFTAGVLNIGL